MNRAESVWPLLKRDPTKADDPRLRSYIIHLLAACRADPAAIVRRYNDERDVSIRRALVLSLGQFTDSQFSADARNPLIDTLIEDFRNDWDPGLHSAIEWLLRRWGQNPRIEQFINEFARDTEARQRRIEYIQTHRATATTNPQPRWYVTGQGQTMTVIPGPVEFTMGSPLTEPYRSKTPKDENPHVCRIDRTFAISCKPVTAKQYRQFDPKLKTPNAESPAVPIDWFSAAKYCNWLSATEGLPEEQRCYAVNGESIKLRANYLHLRGYRLPTEAETEYATRAGSLTARYYGESETLLPEYAWYKTNSGGNVCPVGTLKPNDLGLFDALGNVWCWCENAYGAVPGIDDSEEDVLKVSRSTERVLRCGSYFDEAPILRSASHWPHLPSELMPDQFLGFRVATTLPPGTISNSRKDAAADGAQD
jgi:formylglycine-generating enzyme required for sulfatase activity